MDSHQPVVTNDPVLVILADLKQFASFAVEILRAEGLNLFQVETLAAINSEVLQQFKVVILTETPLTAAQADVFRGYVSAGGNLIALRPDKSLADILGLSPIDGVIEDGYIQVDATTSVGAGLTGETLQFHGSADLYTLNGAAVIPTLFTDSIRPSSFPAVTCHIWGKGQAAAFTYNLPKSVVYTRQGNPAWAGQERDDILGIRAAEMYLGWADVSKNRLNQADEQMRLLTHLIEEFFLPSHPIPRLWYFPGNHRCLVLLTDDGEDSTLEDFQFHFKDIESRAAHMTLYIKGTYISAEAVADWVRRGHEIAAHFDDTIEAVLPTEAGMTSVAKAAVESHYQAYRLKPRSVRNHWIVWYGWSEQASIEERVGIEFDCNLYHYDRDSSSPDYLGDVGGFNGSGLPMKYANRDGSILQIYQALTQLPDEQWLEKKLASNFKKLVDRSLDQEAYTFVNVNFHTDRWQVWSRNPGLEMLDYANLRGVPLWTAAQTLDFLKARDAARIENIRWSGSVLSFEFLTPLANEGFTLLMPGMWNELAIRSVEANGESLDFQVSTIKGRRYAMIPAQKSGSFRVAYN